MGHLVYDDQIAEVQLDDRTLAHLQVVIVAKLRRHESFTFSWKEPTVSGSGRSTIWLHPSVSLRFRFSGSRPPTINGAWIALLNRSANSGTGLQVLAEPPEHDSGAPEHG